MATRKLFDRFAVRNPMGRRAPERGEPAAGADDPLLAAPLGGTRSEAMQRLQIGVTTLAAMLTMIALAGIIGGEAKRAEEAAVPDAAPTTEPTAAPAQRDPLVDAGVVPDIPAEADAQEQGNQPGAATRGEGERGRVVVPDTPPPGASSGDRSRNRPGEPASNAGNAGTR